MNIVSLSPFATELIYYFEKEAALKAVSARCKYPEVCQSLPQATSLDSFVDPGSARSAEGIIQRELSLDLVDIDVLKEADPDIIFTDLELTEERENKLAAVRESLSDMFGKPVRVQTLHPTNLNSIWEQMEQLAKLIGARERGHDSVQRLQSQFLDWADNFYERMKHKKVTVISSVAPLKLAGMWIPDMIRVESCQSQEQGAGEPAKSIQWSDIRDYNPDVIVVTPAGLSLQESMKTFLELEKLPGWDNIPAVKRGEVIFTDGDFHFHHPGPRLRDSMGILVSAMAGLESGYITERDSFYRLRWLEIQRHRLV